MKGEKLLLYFYFREVIYLQCITHNHHLILTSNHANYPYSHITPSIFYTTSGGLNNRQDPIYPVIRQTLETSTSVTQYHRGPDFLHGKSA